MVSKRISQVPYILLSFSFYLLLSSVALAEEDLLFSSQISLTPSEVKIRLLTDTGSDHVILTAVSGQYKITDSLNHFINLSDNESVIIAKYGKRIIVKPRNREGFICDTLYIKAHNDSDLFSLRSGGNGYSPKKYSGELKCFTDMDKLFLINSCDIEKYLEGVVKAEGGTGKNEEYFKTQAIIARTYTYKYINKHILDGFNLCDGTHCQAYDGHVNDTVITKSVRDTKGLVITTPDSSLIISAFHSNCGGETSPSEFAWVTGQPYLKRVVDPYCRSSRNAIWEKRLSLKDWTNMLRLSGYMGSLDDPTVFNFSQPERVADYSVGSFTMPLRTIRARLDLRSAFFSVTVNGDSVMLKGRGYGHGVGLCQEGAINMALKGFTYKQIINFYYFNVLIMDIKDIVILPQKGF